MRKKTEREDGALAVALSSLREMVMAGELMPGEQIRQEEVAKSLGVSRVPLREALNVLAHQGLLLHRPHQGYFVAKRLPAELAQIRRMLQLLEDELLRSIEWPDAECLAELSRLNNEMRGLVGTADWLTFMPLNRQFHFCVFSLSPHGLILNQVARLWDMAEPFMAQKLGTRLARAHACDEHDQMVEALRLRDRAAFIRLLDGHRRSVIASSWHDADREGGPFGSSLHPAAPTVL